MFGLLGGLAGSLLPGLFMMNSQKKQRQNINRLIDEQRSMLQEARKRAGLSEEARAEKLRRARESFRSGQAQRGIFESGVSGAQEAELQPQWEQMLRDMEAQQFMNLAGGYGNIMSSLGGYQSATASPFGGMAQAAQPFTTGLGMMGGESLGQALFPQSGRVY